MNRAFHAMATIYSVLHRRRLQSIEPYGLSQRVCLFDIEDLKDHRADVTRAPTANKSTVMHDPVQTIADAILPR